MASTFPNCVSKVNAHLQFATNGLIAIASGRVGIFLAHVNDDGAITVLDHLDGTALRGLGIAVDVAWTSATTLAAALYEGGLATISVDIELD